VSQKGTPDSIDPALVDQLCDLVISKLEERAKSTLTFNQGVSDSPKRLCIGHILFFNKLLVVA